MKPNEAAGGFRRQMRPPGNPKPPGASRSKPKAAKQFAGDDLDDLDDLMGGDGLGGGMANDESDFFGDNNRDDDLDMVPKKKRGGGNDNDPLAFLQRAQ